MLWGNLQRIVEKRGQTDKKRVGWHPPGGGDTWVKAIKSDSDNDSAEQNKKKQKRLPCFSGKNRGATPSVAVPGVTHPCDATAGQQGKAGNGFYNQRLCVPRSNNEKECILTNVNIHCRTAGNHSDKWNCSILTENTADLLLHPWRAVCKFSLTTNITAINLTFTLY